MDSVDVLCDANATLMRDFSRRCLDRVEESIALRPLVALVSPLLAANVQKETEKDRLVIAHAASIHRDGSPLSGLDAEALFERTKAVDAVFVRRIENPFIAMDLRYSDIAEIRTRRIRALGGFVFELLGHWDAVAPLSAVIKTAFSEQAYRERLSCILHLYNLETRQLAGSFTIRGPAGRLKELLAERLFLLMEGESAALVSSYAGMIYGASAAPAALP